MCCQSNGHDILNIVSSNAPLTKRKKNEGTHSPRSDNIYLIALIVCCPFYEEVLWGAYTIFCMTG